MRGAMTLRDRHTLRAYLRLLGLSERQLAVRADVGHATVNHLLSGRRTRSSPAVARALEQALGCPPGLFFTAAVGSANPADDARRSADSDRERGDVVDDDRVGADDAAPADRHPARHDDVGA
jgi:transcriptional regulator with XRE-family HTH domain